MPGDEIPEEPSSGMLRQLSQEQAFEHILGTVCFARFE